jgi:hypothetical protein
MFLRSPFVNNSFLTPAIAAAAVIFLTGCGGQEVSFKSGGMTHTFAEGKASVPKEFENLIYPDADTKGSVSSEGDNEEQSKFLMLSCTNSIDAVSRWYQNALREQKWTVDKVQDMPKLVSINGHKDDLEVNVMIAEDDAHKTTISLSAGKQVDAATEEKEQVDNYTPDKVNPPTD